MGWERKKEKKKKKKQDFREILSLFSVGIESTTSWWQEQ